MTHEPAEIRHATHDDRDDLVRFQIAMAQESEDKGLDAAQLARGIQHLLNQPTEGFYLVAQINASNVGALMVTYEWSDWRDGRFWWIQSVYVDAKFRRRGVYSALHHYVRSAAKADPEACGIRLYVERENQAAQSTYLALGMLETRYRLFEEEF
jgi:ribosomal protein S18 acetylase RimI-like enzyme